jgi:hypothetical protein
VYSYAAKPSIASLAGAGVLILLMSKVLNGIGVSSGMDGVGIGIFVGSADRKPGGSPYVGPPGFTSPLRAGRWLAS